MKRKFLFTALFTMAISTISTALADTASFYANSLEGQLMKNGKPYSASAYTAASTKYPLNTLLKVSYKKKSVIVRVTDTGKFHKKHLDLSRSAWRHLEKDLDKGIIDVKVEKRYKLKHFSIKDKKNKYGHYTYCFNYESAGFIMTYDWLRSLKKPIKMLIDPDGDKSDLFSASIVVIQHNYFNIG